MVEQAPPSSPQRLHEPGSATATIVECDAAVQLAETLGRRGHAAFQAKKFDAAAGDYEVCVRACMGIHMHARACVLVRACEWAGGGGGGGGGVRGGAIARP